MDSSRSEFKDAVKAEKEDDKDDVRNLSNISGEKFFSVTFQPQEFFQDFFGCLNFELNHFFLFQMEILRK